MATGLYPATIPTLNDDQGYFEHVLYFNILLSTFAH